MSNTHGAWAMLGSPLVVSQLATSAFDWVCLDSQHGAFGRDQILESLRAATPAWKPIWVRVSQNDPAEIGYALDAGATSVIVPMVSTPADAAAAVAATRYPPLGQRSWGPLSPLWGVAAPTPEQANASVGCWVMIETSAGLDAVEEILSVEGITGLFIGPFDLAIALGTTVDALLDSTEPDSPLARIAAAARRHSIALGAFGGSPANSARLEKLGFTHVAVASDTALLALGASAALGTVAGGTGY